MIEDLRYLLRNNPTLYIAQVMQVSSLDADKSEYLVMCKLLPDKGEVVAHATYSLGGVQEKPQAGDVVLVAFAAAEEDYALLVSIFPNTSRTMNQRSDNGHAVLASRPGKKTHIVSDTKVTIGKGGSTEEAEPLVLGTVLTSCLTDLVKNLDTLIGNISTITAQLSTLAGIVSGLPGGNSASGVVTALTPVTAALVTIQTQVGTTDKQKYLVTASTNIKSQIAFTERGS